MYFASEDYTFQSDISSSDEDVGRVVRGTEAKVGQFPHQLLLTRSGASPCGAVLITSILALTAAHCVNERLPSQLTIESARHLRSHDDKFVQKVGVKSVMIHEQFHYTGGAAHNDIAILLLSQEVNFNAYVYPIYVPTTKTRFEETAQGKMGKLQIISLHPSALYICAAAQSTLIQ
ncbi:unnamed protein product [Allacma fusca]|uniref:Peptidase S1 domain-containing protein n=1 Tax=Allacma fusca TaxID=39272 RepID=A0A8J2KBJ0_9HEXA|nr:unnamed protein product [Allacma fusca]